MLGLISSSFLGGGLLQWAQSHLGWIWLCHYLCDLG